MVKIDNCCSNNQNCALKSLQIILVTLIIFLFITLIIYNTQLLYYIIYYTKLFITL